MKRMWAGTWRLFDRIFTPGRVAALLTLFAVKNIAFGNWKLAAIQGVLAVLFGTSLPNPLPRWFSHSHD